MKRKEKGGFARGGAFLFLSSLLNFSIRKQARIIVANFRIFVHFRSETAQEFAENDQLTG